MAAYDLRCEACDGSFSAARPHARTCSHRCRRRLYVQQTRLAADEGLLQLSDAAWQLVASGTLTPEDALELVVWPSDRVLTALATRGEVAA